MMAAMTKLLLATTTAATALLLITGCSSGGGEQQPAAPPSADASQEVAPMTQQESSIDEAGYLAAARKDTDDQVADARLVEIGTAFCQDLQAGKWRDTTIDDDAIVGDLSTQMRINIGFAAVHSLCPDQEAEYLRKIGGALGG